MKSCILLSEKTTSRRILWNMFPLCRCGRNSTASFNLEVCLRSNTSLSLPPCDIVNFPHMNYLSYVVVVSLAKWTWTPRFQFSRENYLDSLLRLDVNYEHSIQGWLCHINKLVLDVDRWWPHTPLDRLPRRGGAHLLLGNKKHTNIQTHSQLIVFSHHKEIRLVKKQLSPSSHYSVLFTTRPSYRILATWINEIFAEVLLKPL